MLPQKCLYRVHRTNFLSLEYLQRSLFSPFNLVVDVSYDFIVVLHLVLLYKRPVTFWDDHITWWSAWQDTGLSSCLYLGHLWRAISWNQLMPLLQLHLTSAFFTQSYSSASFPGISFLFASVRAFPSKLPVCTSVLVNLRAPNLRLLFPRVDWRKEQT